MTLDYPIEAVLLVCLRDLSKGKRKEDRMLSWVVKTWSGGVKQRVIGLQISKDSATEFTISCIHEYISPFLILINPKFPLNRLS